MRARAQSRGRAATAAPLLGPFARRRDCPAMLADQGKSANSARTRASDSADLARKRADPDRLRVSAAQTRARRLARGFAWIAPWPVTPDPLPEQRPAGQP